MDVDNVPMPKPCLTTTGPASTAGLPQKLEVPNARSTTCKADVHPHPDLGSDTENASSFVDQIAALNELARRALGLTTAIKSEPLPNTVPAHTITPTRLLCNADPPSSSTDK